MVYINAVGTGCPEVILSQDDAKELVKEIFSEVPKKVNRLLPIFDHANILNRQLATSIEWYKENHTFATRNDLYIKRTIELSLQAIDDCLENERVKGRLSYDDIDLMIFVSSTGISTPSIDAYLINERPFRSDIIRMPLWGLGCGGGAIGLSRATEWLKLHPTKTALVVCAELCSLTFQQTDYRTSNIVGTALFGDGVAAAILSGKESNFHKNNSKPKLEINQVSSMLQKDTLDIMGWDVTNRGFEVIFSKRIPRLVKTIWYEHVKRFLQQVNIESGELHCLVAHPGGRKVLEEMEQFFPPELDLFRHSYEILKDHGNMSSATVLYVLKKYMESVDLLGDVDSSKWAILSALGPGFCSELVAMRWLSE